MLTVPLPDEAKVSCFFFAVPTSAFSESKGAVAETTSTSGTVPTSATGATSLAGSNGSFLCRHGLMARLLDSPITSV